MAEKQTTGPAPERPENPYARAYADFLGQTRGHELRVLRDEGLYRHLRVQAPGTRMWSWDVTTWPGHLATSGDIADGLVFTRLEDMIDFFSLPESHRDYYSDGAPSIDVRYWAEKLCGGSSHEVKRYDADLFLQQVREHLEEHEELGTEAEDFHQRQLALLGRLHRLRGLDDDARASLFEAHWAAEDAKGSYRPSAMLYSAVRDRDGRDASRSALDALWCTGDLAEEQLDELIEEHGWHELADVEVPRQSPAERREEILDDARWHAGSDSEAHAWLADHEDVVGSDTWEWDLREYDIHFLFACYCIDLAVRLYREHRAEQEQRAARMPVDEPSRIPAALQERIDEVIGHGNYAPYVLDHQSAEPNAEGYHDVVTIEDLPSSRRVTEFTQGPDGSVEHQVLAEITEER